jgi:hypothetical protein
MAFDPIVSTVPERIGEITVTLFDPDPAPPPGRVGLPVRSAIAEIVVVFNDGHTRTVTANIADHFTPTVLNQLIAFVTSVRTKAIAEILPD